MKSDNRKTKVLLALSGGVDSSVAAHLLKKQGYNVIGAFMKMWSDTKNKMTGECSWRDDRRMARRVAAILDIPLITLDFEKYYHKEVVDEMFRLYHKGITPNPDVDCNKLIKFPLLWKAAKKLRCDYIATGHYSKIIRKKGKYYLLRGKENLKDQSYFLYRLTQDDLSHTIFPIGDYSKPQVRKTAKKLGFPNYNRESTRGICFIGKINLKDFLTKKIKRKVGNIINPEGNIIGKHDGVFFYTIGQRIGPRFGIDIDAHIRDKNDNRISRRWYVARKDVKKNIIIAAPQGHPLLFKKTITLSDFHLITDDVNNYKSKLTKSPMNVDVRIRKVGELLPANLSYNNKQKRFIIILRDAVTGISPGQAVVIYKPKSREVLGGGVVGE